jgi:hypothetical protein
MFDPLISVEALFVVRRVSNNFLCEMIIKTAATKTPEGERK